MKGHIFFIIVQCITSITCTSMFYPMTAFQGLDDTRLLPAVSVNNIRSIEDCVLACANSDTCICANFHHATMSCELGTGGTVTHAPGWVVYDRGNTQNSLIILSPSSGTASSTTPSTTTSSSIPAQTTTSGTGNTGGIGSTVITTTTTAAATTAAPSAPCGSGWEKHGQYCYLLAKDPKIWIAAQYGCIGMIGSATLATIKSADTLNFLRATFQSELETGERLWIGGEWNETTDEFIWVSDSTPMSLSFSWQENQPNDNGGYQDCVYLLGDTFLFNDFQCYNNYWSLCEYKNE